MAGDGATRKAKSATWPEIKCVVTENRCELVLSGAEISKRIEEDGLDFYLFELAKLNYLRISKTALSELPSDIGRLSRLSTLSLHDNKLVSIPTSIGHLPELKNLDLSRNVIDKLPEELGFLEQLQTLNLDFNRLKDLPPFKKSTKLLVLDISHNEFEEFSESILDSNLIHLSEIRARGNRISNVPAALSELPSLKILDVVDNVVKDVAGELGDAQKLKEIYLSGNPLKDKRLLKMVDQCHHKQVIDYIRAHCKREQKSSENDSKSKSKKNKKKKGSKDDADDLEKVLDTIRVLNLDANSLSIKISDPVKDVRPYIVCCILRGIDLKESATFKSFISLQTKLHENICKSRTVATIATHDLSKINGNLEYTARIPAEIEITPLHANKSVTALDLFSQLQKDADQLRKEKKRNTYSGVHKYLYLLEGKPVFPCLQDGEGRVISLPPITNSGITKISSETIDVLVEVTGSVSLTSVKEVMDSFIKEVSSLAIYKEDAKEGEGICRLVVQQVKIVDKDLSLKVLYPSHPDLDFQDVKIIRVE